MVGCHNVMSRIVKIRRRSRENLRFRDEAWFKAEIPGCKCENAGKYKFILCFPRINNIPVGYGDVCTYNCDQQTNYIGFVAYVIDKWR